MNPDLPICLLLAAFTGALMLVLPHLSPLRYFFAITVPAGFPSSPAGRASLRRYHAVVVCSVVIAVVTILQGDRFGATWMPVVAMLIPAILSTLAFLWERRQVARQAPPADAVRTVDLTGGDDRVPRWFALVLPPLALPLAAAAWLRARWDDIPARFPIHWNIRNQADHWAEKSTRAVYAPVLFAEGLMLVMILLTVAMFYGSRRGPQRTAIVQMMVATIGFLALVCSGVGLLPLVQFSPFAIIVPAVLFPIALMVWVVKVLRDPRMPAEATPDACWYLGSIYINTQDPAIFVQKRIGFGYTLNMGNRLAWLVMGGLMAAIGALVFVLPR